MTLAKCSLALLLTLASLSPAAVEITPARVEESRSAALLEDKISRPADHLKVVLSLSGPEAVAAVKYGLLKLEEAVDDKGTSLIPAKDPFGKATKFEEYENAFFRKSALERKRKAADPQIEISLAAAKRSATKIIRLRGSFSLAQQGTLKTIELTGLQTPGAKKVAIPAEAGVQVTVKPDKDGESLSVDITGDENVLEELEVVDAAGEKVSMGMSSWSFGGGPVQKSLSLQRPLDDKMKLVAKVALDRKITVVPFDLKDIALP